MGQPFPTANVPTTVPVVEGNGERDTCQSYRKWEACVGLVTASKKLSRRAAGFSTIARH